jgi:hypothetical protein
MAILKIAIYHGKRYGFLYFRAKSHAHAVVPDESFLDPRMASYDHYLPDYYPFFPCSVGLYFLVGPAQTGHTFHGNLLGLALPVACAPLETQY